MVRGGVPASFETEVDAFIPDHLPPALLRPELLEEVYEPLIDAERALSHLEGTASRMANPHILIGPFMRREAMLSSAIENTIATQHELALFEANELPEERRDEVREVFDYVQALTWALEGELPMSLRLIRKLHSILLSGVRGEETERGEFRRTQNYIGSRALGPKAARYVPPPAHHVPELLDNLERYLHTSTPIPRLVQLAIAHYQFEAIHPFSDGNGRVGRLLITLELCSRAQLSKPLVYVSGFFERHRQDYYDQLLAVSHKGDWFGWFRFFLAAIGSQAEDARVRAVNLLDLQTEYHERIRRPRASALLPQLVDKLFMRPFLTVKDVQTETGVNATPARKLIDNLASAGILREITGRTYGRAWIAEGILEAIHEELDSESKT
jgi:Fic family protein